MKPLTTDNFITKSKLVHGELYNYSKTIYRRSNEKVIIMCKQHGEFQQKPNNHLMGQTCPKCNGNIKLTTEEFINRARKIHLDVYDYTHTVYKTSPTSVNITCPKHGEFYQAASSHLRGFGCPKCACYRISVPETEFLDYIKIPVQNRQVCISQRKVDGYDPATNTVYEFLGDYWHGNPSKYVSTDFNKFCKKTFGTLYQETIVKFSKLKNIGCCVKYIWENDWIAFKTGHISSIKIQIF